MGGRSQPPDTVRASDILRHAVEGAWIAAAHGLQRLDFSGDDAAGRAIRRGQPVAGISGFPGARGAQARRVRAIHADINQYSISYGALSLRAAIAAHFAARHGVPIDAESDVTVCCGSTEAMLATMLALVDPGDEVIVFEPFYENYGPGAMMAGGTPVYVTLRPPDWTIDPDRLAAAFSNRTRAIVINTPTNPTGKVFSREELAMIAGCVSSGTCWPSPTRSTSTSCSTAGARADGVAARHGRAHGDHQRPVQDLQRHRLAHRLGHGPAGVDRRHPQDARLSDSGGAGAVSGGRRRGIGPA